jgi:hypothetical protein
MPTIAYFYGIAIMMFYRDHNPPHVNVRYGSSKALVQLSTGKVIAGNLPPKIARTVGSWVLTHRIALQQNWQFARRHQPLMQIGGP